MHATLVFQIFNFRNEKQETKKKFKTKKQNKKNPPSDIRVIVDKIRKQLVDACASLHSLHTLIIQSKTEIVTNYTPLTQLQHRTHLNLRWRKKLTLSSLSPIAVAGGSSGIVPRSNSKTRGRLFPHVIFERRIRHGEQRSDERILFVVIFAIHARINRQRTTFFSISRHASDGMTTVWVEFPNPV